MQVREAQHKFFYGEQQRALVDEALAKLPQATSPQGTHEVLDGLARQLEALREFERCSRESMGPAELKRNYRQAAILEASASCISCICALGDGRLVSGDHSGILRVWRERPDGSWENQELPTGEGVVDRIRAMPGGGFASITLRYDDDNELGSSACFVWQEDAVGQWRGRQLALGNVKTIELSLLPGGGIVSLADRAATVWRRDGKGEWTSAELGQTVHTFAVRPDGRIVVANYATSSIEVWGEQPSGDWTRKKILIDTVYGTENLQVLRCGRIVSKHGNFWSDGSQVFVLTEEANGEWSGNALHNREQGHLGTFKVLPSGLVAAGSSRNRQIRLWRETSRGEWSSGAVGESELDISNLHELPSERFAEQQWQGAIIVWQPEDSGEWKRTDIWRAGPGEYLAGSRVFPGGDIVSIIASRRLDDDDYPPHEENRLMLLRGSDNGSFSCEEASLHGVSRRCLKESAHIDVRQTKVVTLPDGKLVVRLGTNQLFIFDGDTPPEGLK